MFLTTRRINAHSGKVLAGKRFSSLVPRYHVRYISCPAIQTISRPRFGRLSFLHLNLSRPKPAQSRLPIARFPNGSKGILASTRIASIASSLSSGINASLAFVHATRLERKICSGWKLLSSRLSPQSWRSFSIRRSSMSLNVQAIRFSTGNQA